MTTTISLHQTIESARYAATHAQVEQLARAVVDGQASAGVYLQTLIVATQAIVRRAKRRGTVSQAKVLAALEAAYKPSLAAVQRGVARGETLTPRQLAARCGFARTSASAIRKFVEGGGDILALEPGKVSRRQLRPEGPAVPTGANRYESTVLRAVARIDRTVQRLARRDADQARALVESAIEHLTATLADSEADTPTVTAHRLQRIPAGRTRAQAPVQPVTA